MRIISFDPYRKERKGRRLLNALPFPEFYLVHRDDIGDISKVFPWSVSTDIHPSHEFIFQELKLDKDTYKNYRIVFPVELFFDGKNGRISDNLIRTDTRAVAPNRYGINQSIFSTDTTLHSTIRTVTPICNTCDNSLLNAAGKCYIGCKLCKDGLKLQLPVIP